MPDDLVSIGAVVSAHGLKGEVKVRLFHYNNRRLEALRNLFLVTPEEMRPKPVTIRKIRYIKNIPVVQFHEVTSRTEAEYIRSNLLMVSEVDMVTLAENEYFCHDLIGLTVRDRQNKKFGVVTEIYETGSNDVLVVVGKEGEVLVPILKSVIVRMDTDQQSLIIDPLPGLFEADED